MLICPKCKHQVDDNARFCNFCGVPFVPPEERGAAKAAGASRPAQNPQGQNAYAAQQQAQNQAYQQQANPQPAAQQRPNPGYQQQAQYAGQGQNPAYQQQNPNPGYQQQGQYAQPPQYQQGVPYPQQPPMPVAQLKTDRSFIKTILLSLVTFGIYGLIVYGQITDDVNLVCTRYDNKKNMNYYLLYFLVGPVTCGIYTLIWWHTLCDRIDNELKRRGIAMDFSASTFWLWNVLGSLILVGPFIFAHKFFKAVNTLNDSFNRIG